MSSSLFFQKICKRRNHHASSSGISEARVCVTYVTRLYDKTKVAQYASIIEENDEARVKFL
jgi:hypothetical protein